MVFPPFLFFSLPFFCFGVVLFISLLLLFFYGNNYYTQTGLDNYVGQKITGGMGGAGGGEGREAVNYCGGA